ncbi:RHS repeat-associated core domain-containing protein [Flavobacterium davisii]|uniref:RHS repeat-associated core domain-containing protein n=1 Tax=Flavobacterium davisii TaxID=2906077 RepID=UPI0035D07809
MSDVLSYNDYYPFGSLIPNRHGSSTAYRYGFQGQEKDDELKGEGNSLNYTFRMHDPRVGRFFAIDPLTHKYPYYSPYQFSGNRVVDMIEMEGLEPTNTKVNTSSQPKGDYWEKTDSKGNYTGRAYPTTELNEITVTGTYQKKGFYGGPLESKIDENNFQFSGVKVGFRAGKDDDVNHFNTELKSFNINLSNNSSEAAYDFSAEVSGVEGKLNGSLGYKNWIGIKGGADGSAFKAFANTKNGFSLGDNGVYGYKQGMGAGALALEGNLNVGVNFLGFNFNASAGGTVSSVHAGYNTHLLLNTKTRMLDMNIDANAGWILGIKAGVNLKFDYGIYVDLFKD